MEDGDSRKIRLLEYRYLMTSAINLALIRELSGVLSLRGAEALKQFANRLADGVESEMRAHLAASDDADITDEVMRDLKQTIEQLHAVTRH